MNSSLHSNHVHCNGFIQISDSQGFETITNTLPQTILLLALFPEVQEKLSQEMKCVFETTDEEVTENHFSKLVYTKQVINESMRFWSPIPFIGRPVLNDIKIGKQSVIAFDLKLKYFHRSGDYILPKGASIAIPIVHIHRDKEIWGDDAVEFRPERSNEEKARKVHNYAFLPFSRGPRTCLGLKYAMNSMIVVLAHILRNFKVTSDMKIDEIAFKWEIMMKSAQGYKVTLEERKFLKKILQFETFI